MGSVKKSVVSEDGRGRGAHLLLQTRSKVLNKDLQDDFRGWLPTVSYSGGLTPDLLTLCSCATRNALEAKGAHSAFSGWSCATSPGTIPSGEDGYLITRFPKLASGSQRNAGVESSEQL
jgi:hypothetical protein